MEKKHRAKYGPVGLTLHALIDWVLVVIGFSGPFLLGYWSDIPATAYTFLAAGVGLGLNFITDYPGGVAKKLPMMWHQLVEWTSPIPFIVVPWLLFKGFTSVTLFLTAIGIAIVLNTMFTRKLRVVVKAPS